VANFSSFFSLFIFERQLNLRVALGTTCSFVYSFCSQFRPHFVASTSHTTNTLVPCNFTHQTAESNLGKRRDVERSARQQTSDRHSREGPSTFRTCRLLLLGAGLRSYHSTDPNWPRVLHWCDVIVQPAHASHPLIPQRRLGC
jgi:hypothetical protein